MEWQCRLEEFEFIKQAFSEWTGTGGDWPDPPDCSRFDWERLAKMVENHRLWAPALKMVRARRGSYPDAFAAALEDRFRAKSMKNMMMLRQMVELGAALDGRGIFYVALKGSHLSGLLYGEVNSRFSNDMDIYVDQKDFSRAETLFSALGYECADPDFGSIRHEYYFLGDKHVPYVHRESRSLLEVHVRISDHRFDIRLPPEGLRGCTDMLDIGGSPLRILRKDFLLAYLSYHGAKHRWQRLFWLADTCAIQDSMSVADRKSAMELMRRLGCDRSFSVAMELRQVLSAPGSVRFQSGVPARVFRSVFEKWNHSDLADAGFGDSRNLRSILFDLAYGLYFLRGFSAKGWLVFRRFFFPRHRDFMVVKLCGVAAVLYFIIRPFRLALYYSRKIAR